MAYSISTAFAIYFVLWWIVLFVTLGYGAIDLDTIEREFLPYRITTEIRTRP